ncbi:MAG: hypothetical protein MO847_07305 [Candidatus Protistobacter heckmanni]|nr:hypothetical protein [Candidatus Protistobacter heckmanni]
MDPPIVGPLPEVEPLSEGDLIPPPPGYTGPLMRVVGDRVVAAPAAPPVPPPAARRTPSPELPPGGVSQAPWPRSLRMIREEAWRERAAASARTEEADWSPPPEPKQKRHKGFSALLAQAASAVDEGNRLFSDQRTERRRGQQAVEDNRRQQEARSRREPQHHGAVELLGTAFDHIAFPRRPVAPPRPPAASSAPPASGASGMPGFPCSPAVAQPRQAGSQGAAADLGTHPGHASRDSLASSNWRSSVGSLFDAHRQGLPQQAPLLSRSMSVDVVSSARVPQPVFGSGMVQGIVGAFAETRLQVLAHRDAPLSASSGQLGDSTVSAPAARGVRRAPGPGRQERRRRGREPGVRPGLPGPALRP